MQMIPLLQEKAQKKQGRWLALGATTADTSWYTDHELGQ